MTRYLVRRLASLPLLLLFVNFLGFAYAHLAGPGQLARNPFSAASGGSAPLLSAYGGYLGGVARGEFGAMPPSGAPVGAVVGRATVASLGLLTLTLALSVPLGVWLGMRAVQTPGAHGRDGSTTGAGVTRWLTAFSTIGLAMPGFYIGSMLILFTLWYLIWGPTSFPIPVQGFGWDLHLLLPTVVLAARPTAQLAQMTAGLLASELDKMYVMAARSTGLPWAVIRRRQAFRNIIAPLVVAAFSAFRLVVGELVVVEWIFSWPGLGRLLAATLLPPQNTSRSTMAFLHPPTLAAVLTVLALLFLLGDLGSALLARWADPQLREQTGWAPEGDHG